MSWDSNSKSWLTEMELNLCALSYSGPAVTGKHPGHHSTMNCNVKPGRTQGLNLPARAIDANSLCFHDKQLGMSQIS